MTDTEKERELTEEGMEMNKENLVELGEEKESSLAADQESVTGNTNLNNFNIDSSKEEEGSSVSNEPAETGKDETLEDPPASHISDISEKPGEEDISETPPIHNKENREGETTSTSDTDESNNSISEIKSKGLNSSSGNDLSEGEELSAPENESSEINSSKKKGSAEEAIPAPVEISKVDEIKDKADPHIVPANLPTEEIKEAIKKDKDRKDQPENGITEKTKSESTTTSDAQSSKGENQETPIDKNGNTGTKDVETAKKEEEKDKVHLDDGMEEEE